MKRNSKILLLLAVLLSGILGVYFIGCEGDDTTIIESPEVDKVVGSIEGIISDAFDNQPLPNVRVFWINGDVRDSVITDDKGYFLIDDKLASGDYKLTVEVSGYATTRVMVHIPTFDEILSDIDETAHGTIEYRATICDLLLFRLCAGIEGQVFAGSPLSDMGKEGESQVADDDTLVSPAGNVEVQLEYNLSDFYDKWYDRLNNCTGSKWVSFDVVPHRYVTTTDQSGHYVFNNVPCVPDYSDYYYGSVVKLRVLPFSYGDSSYSEVVADVDMVCCETVTQPNIYAPLDCSDVPQVLRTNFDINGLVPFHYDSVLRVTFSEPMDTVGFSVHLEPYSDTAWLVDLNWLNDNQVLEIDPLFTLLTDKSWYMVLTGKSQDGCPTNNRSWYFEFVTKDGISLMVTNFQGSCDCNNYRFPLDSPLVLTFNMPPVINSSLGVLKLEDWTDYPDIYLVDIDSQVVGNDLIVTPDNPLEPSHTYRLTYKLFSSIPGDYVSGYMELCTETDTVPPGVVSGFALDEAPDWTADWNTTMIHFKWNTVPGADGYKIYAKDNNRNTDFIVVGTFPHKDYLQYQMDSVVLPEQFDLYFDDSVQSPFSGGTVIEFDIRAYKNDPCGGVIEGPFTGSVIPVQDETPPAFDVTVCGSADNYLGTAASVLTVDIGGTWTEDGNPVSPYTGMLEYCEGSGNPTFTFVEGGGDASYVLPTNAVSWTWDADLRDGTGTITVPAGMVGAGDYFIVQISDNSGNVGVDTVRLTPFIDITRPTSTDTTFEFPSGIIEWADSTGDSNCETQMNTFTIYISWDNGVTWVDTIENVTSPYTYSGLLNDTLIVNGTALIGIEDYNNPSWRWLSEPFTVNGIMITSPDSASYFNMTDTIFDAGNTDSTLVPIAWNSTSFISEVVISYSDNNGATWNAVDTVANTGTYDFYPPDIGADYDCWLRVADADADGRPQNSTSWYFHVNHDTVIFASPSAGEIITGGTLAYDITWNNGTPFDTLPSLLDIDYAIDAQTDTNWIELANATENDGVFTWDTIPYNNPTDFALLRIVTGDSTEYISDFFSISGLKLTAPVGGEDWDVGSSQTITWDRYGGFSGNVDIYYSTDGGANWTPIATDQPNTGSYNWTVPNAPTDQAMIKVQERNGLIYDVSDNVFTIAGIIVTLPNGGETWLVGRADSVMWNVIGDIGDSIGISYSIDNGVTFDSTLTPNPIANSGLHVFTVPTFAGLPYNQCYVRVYDWNGTAADTSDAVFTIDQPYITITAPVSTDTLQMGTSFNITWDTLGLRATSLEIRLSTDGGTTFPLVIDTVSAQSTSYLWNIPNLGSSTLPNCMIRIEELDIPNPLNDESDVFVIIP
jgi:hypothetical protein